MADHDNGYKLLFSHAPMVADCSADVAELVEDVPGGLERYRPGLRYCLLDEMRLARSELESVRNLAAALFRLRSARWRSWLGSPAGF